MRSVKRAAYGPQRREETLRDGARQILRAERSSSAACAGANDALDELHMQKAPAGESLFEFEEPFDEQEERSRTWARV